MPDLFGANVDLPETPEHYANTAKFAFGPYDFILEFGLQGVPDAPGSERPPVRNLARIRLSPQHALVVAKLFLRNVRQYEAQFGKINLPPRLLQDLGLDAE